jgi:hypothetical protein
MNYPRFLFPSLVDSFEKDSESASLLQVDSPSWQESKEREEIDLYRQGYEACQEELEDKLQKENYKNKLVEILQSAFDSSNLSSELFEEVLKHSIQILEQMIEVLCLEMRPNFILILQRLFKLIRQHYKEGSIKIEVNKEHYQVCLDMVKDLPDTFFKKDMIQVSELSEMNKDVCRIRYNSTIFEYDKNQIMEEIKEQLKSAC